MEVYFDNSATTPCTKEVCDAVVQVMMNDFGNPSSAHFKGMQAERILRDARESIAATLRCSEKEIFFTSGGTESDNWAIIGSASANMRRGKHLITTSIEHAAILQTMKNMEEQGYRVTYLPVDDRGLVDPQDLKNALDEETILVSVMTVNNESGSMQPIEKLAKIVKDYDPAIIFHTDAVQAYGKMAMRPGKTGIDLISVSGHKLHGPKGTGFLYIKQGTKIRPMITGGGQQKGMRSGTDNVPGAVGLAAACKTAAAGLEENVKYMRSLQQYMIEKLNGIKDVVINTPDAEHSAPHIVSAAFLGVRSEVLLHALEDKGICVSAGSACSTNKKLPVSGVLVNMHMPRPQAESTLRFSFSTMNTISEIDYVISVLEELLPMLRRYARK